MAGVDIVAELVQMALDIVPNMTPEAARTLEARIRERWGGEELGYVARRPRNPEATRRAIEEAMRSGRVSEAATRHGISRQTLYRLLKR